MKFNHKPVLLEETISALDIKEDGIYVDCTLGGGGHSSEILKRLGQKGRLIGIDQDKDALNAASKRLEQYKNVTYVHDNFYNIDKILDELDIENVDGVLMDLGVSSYQLDNIERGFSYMRNASLDMRMDTDQSLTAYDVVNKYSLDEIFKIIKNYGEDRFSRRIAKFIVESREKAPIETTFQLVDIIKEAVPMRFQNDGHPAKRTFQAIRIEVNRELSILDRAVEDSVKRIKSGGRLAVITFHSLEDRKIKVKFKNLQNPCTCPPDFPICVCGKVPVIKIITRKPIIPTEDEREKNSRSRSAKLRVAEKI
ncbi:16S rRNA (cytosine(1402)-N(4))-methyltransferase RsmH [Clostridium tyrobutyricum]|jgi:16S rRNA (cytosine1402-N4)-methyltransferase|uniref:Ribosomal RNA small subunit methyltransferase H n=1 Tax=Clostridium tyrobutyricum DIVETGP TaxID=1408889 RepID=W6N4D2_CLOTY|nr:16S rRNA (cytosine(1402)-N(4))-methyltransferase RsmH [Clostridium tyrobutyricum]AND85253.1 ribosomal RNA small subunit methyltransferase H [Clostridium tyrobutyricum]ANP69810.1 16S rRNA (cytosine(1402)-N(4))-methyltransferase [Clostridium tyrobutyricum]MBR9646878.1 16S rRNA (cytosine(1402)-N(4))-methyltransferase RsmH [Clostridium tyrobutyricum]MBV4415256.1 16S rRNA (cytosine(1402)-N(4))-methyltransferase RsmH [Clostridium tyrobutyricum]MBV4420927.1 16S rRNA (cytosine(1402)-N(4))-methyltra